MPVVPLLSLAALVNKFTDFLKFLTNKDWNAAVTQLTVWAGGVVAVFLASATLWAHGKGFDVGGIQITDLNGWSKLYAGLSASSVGGVAYDFKKARDDKDSAKTPALLPSANTPPAP